MDSIRIDQEIQIWKEGAVDALETSDTLFNSQKYDHSLFFLQLALEKLLKAVHWHKNHTPHPFIHDLFKLAKQSHLPLKEVTQDQLLEISSFYVAGRYKEYKRELYKKSTKEYTEKWREIGKKLFDRFRKELP